MLDASCDEVVLKQFLPDIEVIQIEVDAPFQTVIQIDDKPFGKTRISPDEKDDDETAKRKFNERQKLSWLIETQATKAKADKVGVILPLGAEEAMAEEGLIGKSWETMHFNATSGKDGMRDVTFHVVVGRPEPKAFDLMVKKFGIDPNETIYVEDIAKNLSIGKERGCSTVWLINNQDWGKMESDKNYIDYKFENLL